MMKDRLNVMIVEDDELYSAMLCKLLQATGTCNVIEVSTAERASGMFSSFKPDLIFLDNQLPMLKGTDVVKLFKEYLPNVVVVLMSYNFKAIELASGIREGADYLFDKLKIAKAEINKITEAVIESKGKNLSISQVFDNFKFSTKESIQKTIAILEDNELFAFYLSYTLNQTGKNHIVSSFNNIKDFLFYLNNNSPDYVFLDYYLPDGNGKFALEQCKLPQNGLFKSRLFLI